MNELVKECNICGEDKFLCDYRKGHNQCTKCIKGKKKKKHEESIKNNDKKKCKECGVEKSYSGFQPGSLNCKECYNKKQKKKHKHAIENNDTKVCKECSEEKYLSDYKKGHNQCKSCLNKKALEKHKQSHKENVLDSAADGMRFRTVKDIRKSRSYYKNILKKLLKIQENKCFYSGEPLTVKQGFYNTISPERINESERGYDDIDNLRAICQIFQSASNSVNIEGSTIIASDMRNQILENPYTIQRISNEHCQNLTNGIYKKVIDFKIDFENEDEVKEEMKYLPNKMNYNKRKEAFVVMNKEGDRIHYGKGIHNTKVGRFELAMEEWKNVYKNDYEINDDKKYIEYFVYHYDILNKIYICPETKYMTFNIDQFKVHKIYNEFPDCIDGKAQWSKEKFDQVKELSTREDSQERKAFIDKMIDESKEIVETYRNNDVKIENHTVLTFLAHKFACNKSIPSLGRKKGEYKDLFLTYYDKVCKYRFRCEYTNIPMSLIACKDWNMSYDRYNNDDKYRGTNIAFVCNEFNTSIHWMPQHFKKFWNIDVPHYVKINFIAIELQSR